MSESRFVLATKAYTNGDTAKAEKEFRELAMSGDTEAMVNLGVLYYRTDKTGLAEEWLLAAIGQGEVDAAFNLALLYHETGDKTQSLFWQKVATDTV